MSEAESHHQHHHHFSPVQSVHSRVESIYASQSPLREIDARHAHGDVDLLHQIGYKQELKRTFSTFQVFGIAYSIMGLLPSIASLAGSGLGSGPAGFLWSWAIASCLILCVGISMSELSSSAPTSGGLYFYTNYYAPPKFRVLISFIVGISNTLALCSGLCSIDYGFAEEVAAAVYINKDGDFDITNPILYGIFAACIVSHVFVTCLNSKGISILQTVSAVCNSGLIVLYLIALPIGTANNRGSFNGRGFIFGEVQNTSDWTKGWEFMLSMMVAVWTIGAFDSCVHMSEEAKNASTGVPIGIVGSISVCGFLGFFIIICTTACMNPDVATVLATDTGFPLAQIIYDSLGKKWAVAMMVLIACCQWLMGASILAALSRQIWAFARDNGLPFHSFVKVVDKRLKVPLRAAYFAGVVALALGCLTFAGSAAASALFSLAVSGNYLSWCTPVFLRLTSGKSRFQPGPFYLGKFSTPLNWLTCVWGLFVIVLSMFPGSKSVDKTDMNYAVVINCGVWILAAVYFWVYKYKYYHGPVSNLDAEDVVGDNIDDIVMESSSSNEKPN